MAIVTEAAELTRLAWSEYAEGLHGLEGAEYEQAEALAWERLQETLDAVADTAPHPSDPIE